MAEKNVDGATSVRDRREDKAGLSEMTDFSGGTVTRAHLAEAIHLRIGIPRVEAAQYVEMFISEICDTIVAREEVKLSSFGSFCLREKKERLGRNPKTGVNAKISARIVVSFKPSNILKARISGESTTGTSDNDMDINS